MRKWTNKLIQRLSNIVCVLHSRESENERGKNWNDCCFLSVRKDGRERERERWRGANISSAVKERGREREENEVTNTKIIVVYYGQIDTETLR